MILDSPPVLFFVDATMVAKHTDGIVMVYRSGKISRLGLKRACSQAATSGVNLLGIILNDVRATDMSPRYSYYSDYGGYGAYHTAETKDETHKLES